MHLPPLRKRDGDVRLLIDHFLDVFNSNLKKPVKGLDQKALNTLLSYYYPGNVRELRNILEYAVTVCQGNTVRSEHLPKYMTSSKKEPSSIDHGYEADMGTLDNNPESPDSASESISWTSVEKKMIMDALMKTGGKRGLAAELLGWGRSTLWRKIKQHGLG